MKKTWILAACAALLVGSCAPAAKEKNKEETSTEAKTATASPTTFGIVVSESNAIELPALTSKMDGTDSLADLTIRGKVKEVCQMKGCWMTLEQPDGSTMRVTFKDYALFMPKDIAGKEVVLHGKAEKKIVPVEELKHYAEDAGKSAAEIAAITEPQNNLRFEADGVLLK